MSGDLSIQNDMKNYYRAYLGGTISESDDSLNGGTSSTSVGEDDENQRISNLVSHQGQLAPWMKSAIESYSNESFFFEEDHNRPMEMHVHSSSIQDGIQQLYGSYLNNNLSDSPVRKNHKTKKRSKDQKFGTTQKSSKQSITTPARVFGFHTFDNLPTPRELAPSCQESPSGPAYPSPPGKHVKYTSDKKMIDPYVNEMIDPYVNEMIDPYVNKMSDPYVNEMSDPYVNEMTDPYVNEMSDSYVNEMIDPYVENMEYLRPVASPRKYIATHAIANVDSDVHQPYFDELRASGVKPDGKAKTKEDDKRTKSDELLHFYKTFLYDDIKTYGHNIKKSTSHLRDKIVKHRKKVLGNKNNELYFLNVQDVLTMVEDMDMMYRQFIHILKEKYADVDDKTSVLEDMKSLYPTYLNESKNGLLTEQMEQDTIDTAENSKKTTSIAEDISALYGNYLKERKEKKQLEKDDWECFIFHYDAVEDGPLGRIVSISKDTENKYYQALVIPTIDNDSDEEEMNVGDALENIQENNSSKTDERNNKREARSGKTKTVKPRFMRKLEKKAWYKFCSTSIKFLGFFVITMVVLILAALCFAQIEDPLKPVPEEVTHNESTWHSIDHPVYTSADFSNGDYNVFLIYLKQQYNLIINTHELEEGFLSNITFFVAAYEEKKERIVYNTQLKDRDFILKKWIYFMVIATTTIGFGDVVPRTDSGKIFYIAFSIIGIPLMMLLLKQAGEMITLIHTKFFKLVSKHWCLSTQVSEELLSAIAVFFLFITYLLLGCIFLAFLNELDFLDSLYFWINSFTTVGFGDIVPSLETEIKYISILVPYQIFGLTLLASLIDAWLSYLQYRKDEILRKNKRKLMLQLQKVKRVPRFVVKIPSSPSTASERSEAKDGEGTRNDK